MGDYLFNFIERVCSTGVYLNFTFFDISAVKGCNKYERFPTYTYISLLSLWMNAPIFGL